MWIRFEILVICKRLYKSRKKCGYFYYLLNRHKIFHLFVLCLQRFMENPCTTHPKVIAFMVRDLMALNDIFSIFPLAVLIKLIYNWCICRSVIEYQNKCFIGKEFYSLF